MGLLVWVLLDEQLDNSLEAVDKACLILLHEAAQGSFDHVPILLVGGEYGWIEASTYQDVVLEVRHHIQDELGVT